MCVCVLLLTFSGPVMTKIDNWKKKKIEREKRQGNDNQVNRHHRNVLELTQRCVISAIKREISRRMLTRLGHSN